MAIDFKAMGAAATAAGVDMTKAVEGGGGGDYTPPAAGVCNLRLVSYVEIGKHEKTFQGKTTLVPKAQFVFEVSGPKHPPTVLEDGTKVPHRITIEENIGMNPKSRFFKLFGLLNYAGQFTHAVQAVGEAYRGVIIHRLYKKATDAADKPTGVAPELWNKDTAAWTISPPRYEVVDPETGPTGEFAMLKVAPALTELKGFLWQFPTMETWNSLHIDGEYPERKDDKGVVIRKAKSKNVIQAKILSAKNIAGSPLAEMLAAGGKTLDIPDVEDTGIPGDDEDTAPATQAVTKPAATSTPTGQAATDMLAGIVG